jgi:hypothetical protein
MRPHHRMKVSALVPSPVLAGFPSQSRAPTAEAAANVGVMLPLIHYRWDICFYDFQGAQSGDPNSSGCLPLQIGFPTNPRERTGTPSIVSF